MSLGKLASKTRLTLHSNYAVVVHVWGTHSSQRPRVTCLLQVLGRQLGVVRILRRTVPSRPLPEMTSLMPVKIIRAFIIYSREGSGDVTFHCTRWPLSAAFEIKIIQKTPQVRGSGCVTEFVSGTFNSQGPLPPLPLKLLLLLRHLCVLIYFFEEEMASQTPIHEQIEKRKWK